MAVELVGVADLSLVWLLLFAILGLALVLLLGRTWLDFGGLLDVLPGFLPFLDHLLAGEEGVNVDDVFEEAPLVIDIRLEVKSLLLIEPEVLSAVINEGVAICRKGQRHVLVNLLHSFEARFCLRSGHACLV